MHELVPAAEKIAALLKARNERIAIAESSTGGLISAALVSVPGASAYFLGGAVVYTKQARSLLLEIPQDALAGMRPSTEAYARLVACTVRERFSATWGLAETGASGPGGNSYGDAPGHCCLAVAGPVECAITIETGSAERDANMQAFTARALDLLLQAVAR